MNLQVLLSAMYLESYRYINTLNITGDCIVVNQCNENVTHKIEDEGRKILFISTQERGLSRSRNMAIKNATADICILCDNDVEYVKGYEKIILEAFERNPKYSILAFHINKKTNDKPLFSKEKRMNVFSVGKVGSPQIAFRRDSIKNIKFNTDFGAGSKYSLGEDSIFLHECLRNGLKIKYIPIKIAELREEDSTWFSGFTKKYFIDRGACIYVTSKHKDILCLIKIIAFAIFKYKIYKSDLTLYSALKYMIKGKNEYKNKIKNNIKMVKS